VRPPVAHAERTLRPTRARVVPLTARPFGDVFTRPRPVAVSLRALRHARASLAPRTVPESPDRALPPLPGPLRTSPSPPVGSEL